MLLLIFLYLFRAIRHTILKATEKRAESCGLLDVVLEIHAQSRNIYSLYLRSLSFSSSTRSSCRHTLRAPLKCKYIVYTSAGLGEFGVGSKNFNIIIRETPVCGTSVCQPVELFLLDVWELRKTLGSFRDPSLAHRTRYF